MKISFEHGFVARARRPRKARVFLLLQGVCSPFFVRLADQLEAEGHRVFKVNFTVGDSLYWPGRAAWAFRGNPTDLPQFLAAKYRDYGITDQILFGDCRPVHLPAVREAKLHGVRTHVFEEGYFRPHWVTLERGGVNAHSRLPRDPAWFIEAAARLPEVFPRAPFVSSFAVRALHDVAYHLAGALNSLLYSGYRSHAPDNAAAQYLGYAKRLPMLNVHAQRDQKIIHELLQRKQPYFLLPLQLDGDAQIRHHSRFDNMAQVMRDVLLSFAHHAPDDAHLLIKNHPLDIGLANHGKTAHALAREYGLCGRVHFVETGDLERLLRGASGMVTVNSTAGSVALGEGCPTVCLADPVYNVPGLTFQEGLDNFWHESPRPDANLFHSFRKTVIHSAQVNGGFYSAAGIALAVANAVPRLVAERSPLEVLV